jgi:hypothetical protein
MSINNSKKKQEQLVEQVINLLKEHDLVERLFEKFDIDPEYIHKIKIEFGDIGVSAKANKNSIVINKKFLDDGNIVDDLHYLVHELVHVLQYLTGFVDRSKNYKFKHYLDNPLELQAFREQIKFIREYKNNKEADTYLEELLDFHEITGKARAEKERILRDEK